MSWRASLAPPWPCSAAMASRVTASIKSRPLAGFCHSICPRSNWASSIPLSAARRRSATPLASSFSTPRPSAYRWARLYSASRCPAAAAFLYQRTASASSTSTPSPSAYMPARLFCEVALPPSAERLYQRAASARSWSTPSPCAKASAYRPCPSGSPISAALRYILAWKALSPARRFPSRLRRARPRSALDSAASSRTPADRLATREYHSSAFASSQGVPSPFSWNCARFTCARMSPFRAAHSVQRKQAAASGFVPIPFLYNAPSSRWACGMPPAAAFRAHLNALSPSSVQAAATSSHRHATWATPSPISCCSSVSISSRCRFVSFPACPAASRYCARELPSLALRSITPACFFASIGDHSVYLIVAADYASDGDATRRQRPAGGGQPADLGGTRAPPPSSAKRSWSWRGPGPLHRNP